MCLGHVYIVLEPVGSARLTFDDDLYYEFIYFDVSKVVRSPGYDHGHDEELWNGPEIKIDIWDNSVWSLEGFRNSPEGVPRTLGKRYGPYGPREETHQPHGAGAPPHIGRPRWRRKGGKPTATGSRTPLPWVRHERAGPPLLHSFIYRGGGTP